MLGRLRRQPLEAPELALGLLPRVLGQVRLLELLAQLLRLGLRLVDLAELLLDRLELLAQEVLALALLHLRLDLRLDPRADLDELELAREDLGQQAEPPGDVHLLEQLLLLLGPDPQRARDHVRQLRGIVEVRDRDLELLRQVGNLLDDPREGGLHVPVQRLELGRRHDLVGRLLDAGDEVRVGGDEVDYPNALGAVDEDSQGAVGNLQHARDHTRHAHPVELPGAGLLGLGVLRGGHRQHPVAGEHVVHEPDRTLLADRERGKRLGEGHAVAQGRIGSSSGRLVRTTASLGSPFADGIWMLIRRR